MSISLGNPQPARSKRGDNGLERRKCFFENPERFFVVKAEGDALEVRGAAEVIGGFGEHEFGGLVDGEPVDAGADGGEGDGPEAFFLGQGQAVADGPAQFVVLAAFAPDGTTVWMTNLAGSLPPEVITASPASSGPRSAMMVSDSVVMALPPLWAMARATPPPWARNLLAALTMASTGSAVMSPWTSSSTVAPICLLMISTLAIQAL